MRNKKAWLYWIISSLVLLLFGSIHLLFDWLSYNSTLNSAPFFLWILVNAAIFGIPAVVCGLVGWILWKKSKKQKG